MSSPEAHKLSKVTVVKQGPDESPSAFLEHFLSGYWLYTPIEPEDLANLKAINQAFVAQSDPDRCIKTQKINGFAAMNRLELLEIAQKVSEGREGTVSEGIQCT